MKTLVVLFVLSRLSANQSVIPVNFQCGLKPLPPFGCKSEDAVCVCDRDGNCQWQFIGCGN